MDHTLKGWKACFGCNYRTDGRPERDTNQIELLLIPLVTEELDEYLDEMLDELFGVNND
jgi:hypothetical protein